MEDKPKKGTYAYNKEYAKRWEEKQDVIKIRVPSGRKAIWREAADKAGESLTQYVVNAVEKRLETE